MDNLDLLFIVCFSSFYCQLYLVLRDVQCDVPDNLPFKFNLNGNMLTWAKSDS